MNKYVFKCGEPELRYIPVKVLSEIAGRVLRTSNYRSLFGYSTPQGSKELREAIASIIAPLRGIDCTPEEILIVSGAQNAYSLIAEFQRIQLNESCVVLENPGYSSIRKIVSWKNLRSIFLSVDEDGAIPVENNIPNNSIVFLTPNNQFPTGVTLTQKRREYFVHIAQKKKSLIVEDDYQAPFTFIGNPPKHLLNICKSNEVLYLGTFSKILAPGFRLAFLIGHKKLINNLTKLRWLNDRHSPQIVEIILSKMISEGIYLKYEVKMRQLYFNRWKVMRNSIINSFSYKTKALGGLSIWIPLKLPWSLVNSALNQQSDNKFTLDPAKQWYSKPPHNGAIRLGITMMGCSMIREGVAALAKQLCIIK